LRIILLGWALLREELAFFVEALAPGSQSEQRGHVKVGSTGQNLSMDDGTRVGDWQQGPAHGPTQVQSPDFSIFPLMDPGVLDGQPGHWKHKQCKIQMTSGFAQ
jgi:hypothetical protein